MNIAKLSVKRPTLVIVVFTVLIFLGITAYKQLNYEMLPNFSSPAITIVTVYPGASPAEVENSVTKKIEDAVTSMEGIEDIRSISQEGISISIIMLKLSTNVDVAIQNAQQKINILKSALPEGVKEPMISKFSMDDFPVMKVGVTSSLQPTEMYDLLKYQVVPELSKLKGVGEVSLTGTQEREIKVNLNAKKLEEYNISALQVLQAINSSNLNFPTGKIKNNETELVIRLSAKFKNVEDIKNVIISSNETGSKIRLSDIAEVIDSEKDIEILNRINGKNSIGILIKKQTGANAVKVAELLHSQLKNIEKNNSKSNLHFEVAFDSSIFTMEAASSVMHDLLFAIILVASVMLIFLHGIRNALIVMVAIPISLVISFAGMQLLGYSLNLMTLLAMSLVIGILVDDAIVVLENIYRHMEMGKNKVQATLDGRNEIGYTAIAITLVDVVVFLPIGLSKSMIAPILSPYALVVVMSTLLSLLVAFTVVPMITSRFAKLSVFNKSKFPGIFFIWFENQIDKFGDILHHILVWGFRHKIATLGFATALFIASIMLIPMGFVGQEIFGLGDSGEFVMNVELAPGTTLKETNLKVLEIEQYLSQKKEVQSIFTTIGSSSEGLLSGGALGNSNKAEIDVKLIDKNKRKLSANVFANLIKNELNGKIAGIKVRTTFFNPLIGGTDDSPLQVLVKSTNPDSLMRYAVIIKDIMETTPGAMDVTSSLDELNTEINVEIDKDKMSDLGLSLATVGPVMATAFSGNNDAKYKDGNNEYDITVKYDAFNRKSMEDVKNLTFLNTMGAQVKLSQFANISFDNGSSKLERHNRVPSISIMGQTFGRPDGDVGNEIKEKINKLNLPSNVSIAYDSNMKMQDDAFGSLGLALITAIFFVYLVMVALYNSFVYPFVVLFSIPLAIVGAILALALTNDNLSIFNILGLIMLVGLVAKNAILVVDFTNHLKEKGYNTIHALLTATRTRLRPVLMTTIAMIIGLLPIGLATGAGSEWKNGIAWVLIGGLTSSMFLTLVIVPIVYYIFDLIKIKLSSSKRPSLKIEVE
ncbi:Multidrug transporter MdtC [uncultured Paludibacter sp.]|uniref:Multidrug transporter MdtC n=1 Tax=uncultured Paludibacter sp. TaxID=497635 RepID=A0A653AK29_9BACT|nr:Multidrug transporter MdtC [uncultured Paludibacter sp.]